MTYPQVISEEETLERAIAGENLARYGDGELKNAMGGNCVSQPADKRLAVEIRDVLVRPAKGCLPCIPNFNSKTPKRESWANWAKPPYSDLYDSKRIYGSSFISRPDSAPWIDRPEYWERVKDLWRDKDVTLVAGTQRSLRSEMLTEAKSVAFVQAPSGQKGDGAYAKIDELEASCVALGKPALLCVGPTATVLANRLARRGLHANDLGHVGMFMRSAGAYRYRLDDLISPQYRALLVEKHAKAKKWGTDGAKHAEPVLRYADELQAETILDYGCGSMALAEAIKDRRRVSGYDPGIPGREGMPKPCDLVVCCDVLEHVELERLNEVFGHIRRICLKGAYLVIAIREAKAKLPDGRNAHLIVKEPKWWLRGIETAGFKIVRYEIVGDHEVRVWTRR